MDDLVERVARIIANAMGDNFADAFKNKTRWIAKRGESGGRFRDVNEPMQCDYLAAAEAAIEATGITRLTAERDAALAELRQLTESIWKAEYRKTAPDWQPLPDLVGLITQLDNMYAGVREQRDAAREALWKIERNEDATYSRDLARAALASWQERG